MDKINQESINQEVKKFKFSLRRLFSDVTAKEKENAVENLLERSSPNNDFFLMIFLSVSMATLGLITNNSAVIVGSMLISPVLWPILGIAMGVVMSDFSLISKSFNTLIKLTIFGILSATIFALLFSSQISSYSSEILLRTESSLLAAVIGVIAGFAAAFAIAKEKLNETITGVAISVSLIPPLAVVGIGISRLDISMFFSSLLLFIINTGGVIFASAVVFSLMNFHGAKKVVKETLKEQEKIEKRNETILE